MAEDKPNKRPENVVPLRAPRPCAMCSKKAVPDFHPFCSKHCADVDLNRWLKGSYAIPAVEPPDDWDAGGNDELGDSDRE